MAEKSNRQRELAKIHIARAELCMDDDTYRQLLQQVGKVDSAAKLDAAGRSKLLHRFRELGWKPKQAKQKVTARQPQDRKVRALWLELAKRGIVRDSSERALASYVKRQTGVERLDWLNGLQVTKAGLSHINQSKWWL
ncbi:gp16 family protein [Microbulbifer sp. ANSA003]|uniref:gp16 family protein n=1 Tax=Microbulbifer sp. ANSA003 TaxID=3243360 RepID=UPI0040437A03